MPFRQKSAIAVLVGIILVTVWYVVWIAVAARHVPLTEVNYPAVLMSAAGLLMFVVTAGHVVAVTSAPSEAGEVDERDRLIELHAQHKGGIVLGLTVFGALWLIMLGAHLFWVANALVGGLVLAEIVKAVAKLRDYRRGYRA